MYELIIWIAFWIILYALEGSHDAYIIKEGWERGESTELSRRYSDMWHNRDAVMMVMVHLAISGLTYFYFYDWSIVVVLCAIGVVLRAIFHDLFIDIGLDRLKWEFVGSCGSKWDLWDCLMLKLKKKGINHRVILVVVLVALIVGYFLM